MRSAPRAAGWANCPSKGAFCTLLQQDGTAQQPFKRTQPVLPVADVTPIDHSGSLAVGNEAEETATEIAEDRVVLEQEPDDWDVLSFVAHNAPDTAHQWHRR
jgi:hypothetical protein